MFINPILALGQGLNSQESDPVPNADLLGDFADRMYAAHGLAPGTAKRSRLKADGLMSARLMSSEWMQVLL